jgi:2-keto-3-deoxy-L-rhamnonate aldolase RhmA
MYRLPLAARVVCLMLMSSALSCTAGGDDAPEASGPEEPVPTGNEIVDLLAAGQAVFGMFSPEQSLAGAEAAGANTETDFIFYSLESGPWDIPTMDSFIERMEEVGGDSGPRALTLRIPPIRADRTAALSHIAEGLASGVQGLVFPHVESAEEVALLVDAMGSRLWPLNPDGDLLNVILIEDQDGIERAREIVGAPGVGVAIPGPGDLRNAYGGDMVAVEGAIQTVLEACKEFDVPCGITAGVEDMAERLAQGFRLIIVTQPEALAVGLAAAGR